jgi:hypothetical protein
VVPHHAGCRDHRVRGLDRPSDESGRHPRTPAFASNEMGPPQSLSKTKKQAREYGLYRTHV